MPDSISRYKDSCIYIYFCVSVQTSVYEALFVDFRQYLNKSSEICFKRFIFLTLSLI